MTALPPQPRDPRAAAMHELRTLVQSFHSVVSIETPEEERVVTLVRAAGVDLFIPVHEWTLTTGLRNVASRETVTGTSDPKRMLAHLRGIENSVIVTLFDLTRHLSDPLICRLFREVAHEFSRRQSTLVLCADPLEIPAELKHLVTPLDLPLPTAEELREVVRKAVDVLRQTNRTAIQIDDQILTQFVRHLGGMTLAQARQAIAFAVLGDNHLDEHDLREVIARKAKLLRGASAVEFLPPDLNRTELGGFAGLKSWLQRAAVGFTSQAKELGLQAPRGVLIVGVQGCGKSLAAKAIAREWRMPLLKFDASGLYRLVAIFKMLEAERLTSAIISAHVLNLQQHLLAVIGKPALGQARLLNPLGRAPHARFLAFRSPRAADWCAELKSAGCMTDVRGDVLRIGLGLYHDEGDIDAFAPLARTLS